MKSFENTPSATPVWRQRQRAQFLPNPKGTLREQVHEVMRFFHYSERTEDTYWQWIERFLRFHRKPALCAQGGITSPPSPHPNPSPPAPLPSDGRGEPPPVAAEVPSPPVSLTRPSGNLSHPMGEGGEKLAWRHPREMGAVRLVEG